MAEYIERETMIQAIREYSGFFQDSPSTNHMILKMEAEDVARDLEAADVAPVVHGRWIYDCNATDYGIGGYICSRCKTKNNNLPCNRFKTLSVFSGAKFCPNCGAKMDFEDCP